MGVELAAEMNPAQLIPDQPHGIDLWTTCETFSAMQKSDVLQTLNANTD